MTDQEQLAFDAAVVALEQGAVGIRQLGSTHPALTRIAEDLDVARRAMRMAEKHRLSAPVADNGGLLQGRPPAVTQEAAGPARAPYRPAAVWVRAIDADGDDLVVRLDRVVSVRLIAATVLVTFDGIAMQHEYRFSDTPGAVRFYNAVIEALGMSPAPSGGVNGEV